MVRSFRKEIKEPDSFHVYAEKATIFYESNSKAILVVSLALLISLGGLFGYRAWKKHLSDRSNIALAIAQTGEALRRAADTYPGTRASIIARLRLAMLLRKQGTHKDSEKEYRRLLDSDGISEMDRELALRGLAGTLSLQGKCAKSIPIWRKILNRGSLLTAEDLYISVGNCLEEIGKKTDALKEFEDLVQKHPGSPFITGQIRAQIKSLKE